MNDEDLQPPPERSLSEIVQSIRATIDAGVFEPELTDDLRFFVLVRLAQKFSREEIATEIVQWGWGDRETHGLIESCLAMGTKGEKHVSWAANGQHIGRDVDLRGMARNRREESLLQKAQRMAEAEGIQHNPELAFGDVDLTNPPSKTFRDVNYARLILFLLLGFMALVIIVGVIYSNT